MAAICTGLMMSLATLAQASPAEQYQVLLKEYEEVGGARQFAPRFFELAARHAKDPAADALLWIVKNLRSRPDAARALELLAERHLERQKLGPACSLIAGVPATAADRLLRALLEKSPHRQVRAQACWRLAGRLQEQAEIVKQLKEQPELAPRVIQYYGGDYGEHLASLTLAELHKQQEQLYQQMLENFADVSIDDEPLGQIAERALFRLRQLSIGSVAPEIEGEDIFGKTFKLGDYRGKVVVLSFWGHW